MGTPNDDPLKILESLRKGERPMWLSPTKVFDKNHEWHCCHVGCEKLADVVISGDESFEDYTHMCYKHKDLYLQDYDNVVVEEIVRLSKEKP